MEENLSWTETGSIDMVNCVFCEIVKGSTPSHVLYQDDDFIAILDKYPIAFGHTLVMPKKHFERVNDLSINDGAAANQLIPHVHVHIIPRSPNDSAGFTARKLLKADEMDAICKKLRVSNLSGDV